MYVCTCLMSFGLLLLKYVNSDPQSLVMQCINIIYTIISMVCLNVVALIELYAKNVT